MDSTNGKTISVRYPSDVALAERQADAVLQAAGFEKPDISEMDIVIRELATNLVKHAGGGIIRVNSRQIEGRTGVQIESRDTGPGIRDIERAIADGKSSSRSLGAGLGAVNRLMDRIDISSEPGKGTVIICWRWLRKTEPISAPCPLSVGVATRAYPGQSVNGDSFVVKHWVKSVLISVIDGLGHGQFAHYAAEKARQYVETHYDQPLDDIFRGAGRNCLATRGVVMALARFDWAEDKMTFASIGNIETRVIGGEKPFDLLVRRGIVGLNAPRAAVTEHGWDMSYTMVMHSDGLHSHWEAADLNGIAQEPATVVSARMLSKLARDNDDATVIVVKKDRQ